MLEIFNDLYVFFEDNYREISVREYGKLRNISAPTASSKLKLYEEKGLLIKEKFRNYLFFRANTQGLFTDLQKVYYKQQLEDVVKDIKSQTPNPLIILFGSAIKGEIRKDSDLDIVVFCEDEIEIKQKFYRELQIFRFPSQNSVKNKELLNNILNGYVLSGEWTGKNVLTKK